MELVRYDNLLGDENDLVCRQIFNLLKNEDKSFVPPLSSRTNTTQVSLAVSDANSSIESYFESVIAQSAIVLKEGDAVACFMSYRKNHKCLEASLTNCAYVTTVIVDRRYRGQRLAYDLYNELFSQVRRLGVPVVTRTWSANKHHLHILNQLGFRLVRCICDDRGEGIDTVYYRKDFDARCYRLPYKLKAYKLTGMLVASAVLYCAALISATLYIVSNSAGEAFSELLLAFSTSLLVSAICLDVDLVAQYRSSEHDRFLYDMREMGIGELSLDRQALLADKIASSHSLVFLSGYKHILTSSIAWNLQKAAKRGVRIRLLISPPWMSGFRAAYGNDTEPVYNYIKVIRSIMCAYPGNNSGCHDSSHIPFEVRFTSKVLFSDVCCIDDCYIASPYCHQTGLVRTARDFFTWTTEKNSGPHELLQAECDMLWDTAEEKLDLSKFMQLYPSDCLSGMFSSSCECSDTLQKCLTRRS